MKKLIFTLSIFCILLLSACNIQDNTRETTLEQENTLISSSSMTSSDSTSKTAVDNINKATVETDVVSNTKIETTSAVTEPETEPKATEKDTERIAQKLVEYINKYRNSDSVQSADILSGLTDYAEYRSNQLVTNFAHDTFDERAAATALQYGEYIEPSLYGMTGEPYYTANAREAIAKTDYGGTAEQVAEHLAKLTYNSKSHWSYVGGGEYNYIAVGVTYNQGHWYCCIAMKRENTYEK